MAIGRFIHHFGTFLLFAATILLVVVSISAPVVNNIALLRVDLADTIAGDEVTFGTFGYCVLDVNGRDDCSSARIGYNPAQVMIDIEGTDFSDVSEGTPKALTRVMILHPVAAGICFIAFILCLATGTVGSLLASLVAGLAFIVTLVALICDFVGFGIVRNKVNDDSTNSDASFGIAIWLLLAAAICEIIATVVVFVTCCAGRSRRHRDNKNIAKYDSPPVAAPPRRRRFWQRRTQY